MDYETNYIWIATGKALGYKNWMSSQPDNHGRYENCLHMTLSSQGKWNDLSCNDHLFKNQQMTMCEKLLLSVQRKSVHLFRDMAI